MRFVILYFQAISQGNFMGFMSLQKNNRRDSLWVQKYRSNMLNNLSVFIRWSGGAGNSQRFLRYPLCRRLLLPTDRMGTLRYCQYFVLSC